MAEFITSAEAAKRLSVTSRTITRWIDDGRLPGSFKANSDIKNSPYLIPMEAFLAFEREREEELSEERNGSN